VAGLGPGGKLLLPLGSLFWYYHFMKKSIRVVPKKRGRPATGRDPVTAIRLSPQIRASVDAWAAKQEDSPPRSEAIRRMIEMALGATRPAEQPSPKANAADMAAEQIDKLADKSMPDAEWHSRKRRLIKGPREFRDMRGDQPKAKK
jgi:hypothetical protein